MSERLLYTIDFRTLSEIKGPLLVLEKIPTATYNEMVEITDPEGKKRLGRVLEADSQYCLVQVFVGTEGLDLEKTTVRFTGEVGRLDVSLTMLGRILNGIGQPIDGKAAILPEKSMDLNGLPINPAARAEPKEFIQTGVSAIDGLNSLARGQKLPIFSASGLPANELAMQIANHASVLTTEGGKQEPFAVVFAAMGITYRESVYFMDQFQKSGALSRTVAFLNLANDPTIERLLTPRAALTTAEYLAFQHNRHVLVIMTDMTNYCEALREISVAREELPGRRGYPGYMYSELASLYERAGRLKEKSGSLTQLIILTMPDDDITHPIPDLTGYITEGQIVLSRDFHQKRIFPPIDVLPSLSRLMNAAIGPQKTRADHRALADQLYALYAEGRELRRLAAVVGESALSEQDRLVLAFSNHFEEKYINQGLQPRELRETFEISWDLLAAFPQRMLKKIQKPLLDEIVKPNDSEVK